MFKRENVPKTKPSDDAYLSRAVLQKAQGDLQLTFHRYLIKAYANKTWGNQ